MINVSEGYTITEEELRFQKFRQAESKGRKYAGKLKTAEKFLITGIEPTSRELSGRNIRDVCLELASIAVDSNKNALELGEEFSLNNKRVDRIKKRMDYASLTLDTYSPVESTPETIAECRQMKDSFDSYIKQK